MQVDEKCTKRPTLYCAGVSYLLAPKAHLAFGEVENKYEVDFEETNTGGTAMFEMLMQGMTAKASDDVRDQMKDRIG